MSKKLYHITEKSNLPSIMKHGLIPKNQNFPLEEEKAIFFWDCLELAQLWADDEEVVIEACLPEEIKMSRRTPTCLDTYEYLVYEKIPPKNLRVMPSNCPTSCKKACVLPKGCFYLQTKTLMLNREG